MRKNSPRKWVHAILDLLPLLVIPIFAIYSQRHVIDNNSVTIEKTITQYRNYKQLVVNGLPSSNSGVEHWYVDYGCNISLGADNSDDYGGSIFFDISDFGTHGHYYDFYTINSYSGSGFYFNVYSENYRCDMNVFRFQVFNLTEIFGAGNEPDVEDFESFLNGRYLPYGDNYIEVGTTTETITYDDSDIGSQFIYQMYNVTDKYFNFNQLFNMGSVYDWLNTNMFGGNAPLIVPIVWNIIVYELFMDIIFLFYAVFMFIVDFATNMVDSFLHKSSKGRY